MEASMTRIVSIDPSTKTGVCSLVVDESGACEYETRVIRSTYDSKTRTNEMHRLYGIVNDVLAFIKFHDPHLIVIENYSYSNKFTSFTGVEINAILQYHLFTSHIGYLLIPPTKLKKFVTGKGNANKDVMRLETYKRWGVEAKTDDEIDAFGLAMLGAASMQLISMPDLNMSIFDKDAVVKIVKPF